MPDGVRAVEETASAINAAASTRRFSIHIIQTLLARLLMVVSSVGAGIIVARWLGAAGTGALAVINITVATVVQIGSAGLPSASIYFIARDRRLLPATSINAFIFALIAGSALSAALIGAASVRSTLFGDVPHTLVAVAALAVPFQLVTLFGLNIFLAVGRVDRFNLLDVAGQSFVLINAALVLIVLRSGLLTLVVFNTTASVAVSLVIAWLICRQIIAAKRIERAKSSSPLEHVSQWWRADGQLFRRTLRYAFKFHVSTLAGLLIFRADVLVVNYFRGATEAGVYGVASQMAMMLMLLPGVIATLLFPRAASVAASSAAADSSARSELTCAVARRAAFVMAFICLAAVPLSFAVPLLYGRSFATASTQLLLLLPGVYLISLESVLVQHFNATGLPRAIPLFWAATLIVNVTLTFALVPLYGGRGAALASTFSYAMIFALVACYFRAKTSTPLAAALLPRQADVREMLKRLRG